MPNLVIDTNVVLDLFVFDDRSVAPLKTDLLQGCLQWLATASMRTELERVLGYPHIAQRLQRAGTSADAVLAAFDQHAVRADAPPKAPFTCKDPDDQVFADLAAAHAATLLSKDAELLCMARRLATLGVKVLRPDWFAAQSCQPAPVASTS